MLPAPASGKARAMVVMAKGFYASAGAGSIVYVNLGMGQGVKVGDYFRVFRYQADYRENVYHTAGTAYRVEGFGATPKVYGQADLPRQVIGEGIVVRVGPNAATVLLTESQQAVFMGDYVELE
jgi:hypothetical protein